jgi:hypothetical protein
VCLLCGCSTSRRLPLSLQTSLNPREHSLPSWTAQILCRVTTVLKLNLLRGMSADFHHN